MNDTRRDDFFTLIHKGLRRELFALTTLAGTLDWTDTDDVGTFSSRWRELRHLLEVHAAHEDEHFLPLLRDRAPGVLVRIASSHVGQEAALRKVRRLVDEATAAGTEELGLAVHRELSAFVAGYLPHLLDEETLVMPAIWQHCTDEELARARAAFLRAMPPSDAAISRRAMLPAIAPAERARMLTSMQASAPAPAVAAVLDEVRALLDDRAWTRLTTDLALT